MIVECNRDRKDTKHNLAVSLSEPLAQPHAAATARHKSCPLQILSLMLHEFMAYAINTTKNTIAPADH